MRRKVVIGIALAFLVANQAAAYDLSQHQWRHRLLLLVAPANDDPDLKAQQREIALRRDAIVDRGPTLNANIAKHLHLSRTDRG